MSGRAAEWDGTAGSKHIGLHAISGDRARRRTVALLLLAHHWGTTTKAIIQTQSREKTNEEKMIIYGTGWAERQCGGVAVVGSLSIR